VLLVRFFIHHRAMWLLKLGAHGLNQKFCHRTEAKQMGMGLKLRRNHNQRTTSAFRVHCRLIKLILGSKETEETNLLEFIRKVGLEGGDVGGG